MHSTPLIFSDRWQRKASYWMHSGPSLRSDWWQTQASSRTCWSPCWMRDSDRRCWARQTPQTVVNPRVDVTAQHSLAAQLSHQILCHPPFTGWRQLTDARPVSIAAPCRRMDGSIGRKLTPPQFIRAGVFMRRHVHREGNGGPFLFPGTAGSTVATCVHRTGHMAYSTQLTISAMHAHIKATESIILMLSLNTGSRTLPPHTHARDGSGCRHSKHTTHPPAQPPHPHHQITLQDSQQPSRTRTSSSRRRARGPTRRRTVTIAVIVTRSGVAGASQLIGETEEKECNRGRGRSTADTARESRQHEERAAGPAAQFTHHETASTQGWHTTPAATHHAAGADIHHHLLPAHFHNQREMAKAAATTQRRRSEHPTQRGHTWCSTPAGKETRAVHSLPSPFSRQRKKTTAATRSCQHALQKKHSNPLQCASCVCVCRNTKQRSREKGAEYVERRTKCTAEVRGGNNNKKTAQTHDCTAVRAVAIHTIFIQNKNTFPFNLHKPHHTK
ncbi:hypothetical protein TCDM_09560 [Trypanosoma cruzi Dm28c]|uniref:Uncharacterized protein n=1 Tax=Trypanosoma cruzi Dm28c TaxID=1416333 RepID=V5D5K8_TRYCR|nr:hypothetical protein TCDM_09560 [Trypanosoma cruzi Dm28c]